MARTYKSKTQKYVPPQKPYRDPDYYSKRGVAYWWSPEWLRGTDSTNSNVGRIKPLKEKVGKNTEVNLYMQSKDGNLNFIRGSIQREFKNWHEQRKIDYFFLADDPDKLDEFILDLDT